MKYTTLDRLTVGQYQELYSIHTSEDDDLDKSIASISLLTGLARWQVEDIPMQDFNRMNKEVVAIFTPKPEVVPIRHYVKINSGLYRICLDVKEMCAGQYIDFQHFIKQGMIPNLHKIAACLLTPVKKYGPIRFKGKYSGLKHEAIAEQLRDANFLTIHGACVFFLNVWNITMLHLEPSLRNQLSKMPETMNLSQTDLSSIMGGFIMPNEYPITSGSN